jgi:hypothetical protein
VFQWLAIRECSYFVLVLSRRDQPPLGVFNMNLPDCGYLGFVATGPYDIPDSPPEKRPRERRGVRYRSGRGIGFILSDDPKSLLASVTANDRHGASELDRGNIGIRDNELCAGAPRIPVTKIARGIGELLAVARRLRFAMAPPCRAQRRFDQFQAARRDVVWMIGNSSIRQIVYEPIFGYKGSAHARDMGVCNAFFIPQTTARNGSGNGALSNPATEFHR